MGYRASLNVALDPITNVRPSTTLGIFREEPDSSQFLSSYATFFNPAKSAKLPSLEKSQSGSFLRQAKLDPLPGTRKTPAEALGSFSKMQAKSKQAGGFGSSKRSKVIDRPATVQGTLPSNPGRSQGRTRTKPGNLQHPIKLSIAGDKHRAVMELLTDPNLESSARGIFDDYDIEGTGSLSFEALRFILQTLHVDLGFPNPDSTMVEQLLKKFDTDNSGTLQFNEFMELFISILRRNAFDQSSIHGREFFVNKSQGNVWDDFKKIKELGAGSFGSASLVKCKFSKEKRVVKAVKKSRLRIPVEDVEREIMVMRQTDHPHVVRLFKWYEDPHQIYLVMEALTGGTLSEAVLKFHNRGQELAESWIRTVMYQVLEGMAYCHNLRLIHKDLKDENIMLLEGQNATDEPFAVIIDLGIAEMFSLSDPHCRQISGTPYTMAPEVWMGNYGPKCDVWSLGCVLFELLAGSMPFMVTGHGQLSPQNWLRQHRKGPSWGKIRTSSGGRLLCEAMLTVLQERRPSMTECLAFDWFGYEHHELSSISPEQFLPLQEFCKASALKRSVLLEIASQLPMSSASRIVDIFEQFDADKSGSITLPELQAAFHEMGLHDDDMAKKTFDAMDVGNDDHLSFSEFAAGVLPLFLDLLDDRLHEKFIEVDSDQDGILNHQEAEQFLAKAASLLKKDDVSRSAKIIDDLLRDGRVVRYEELRDKLLDIDMGMKL